MGSLQVSAGMTMLPVLQWLGYAYGFKLQYFKEKLMFLKLPNGIITI